MESRQNGQDAKKRLHGECLSPNQSRLRKTDCNGRINKRSYSENFFFGMHHALRSFQEPHTRTRVCIGLRRSEYWFVGVEPGNS